MRDFITTASSFAGMPQDAQANFDINLNAETPEAI